MLKIRYNAAAAIRHAQGSGCHFALFGVSGGYGLTRSLLVSAVRAGNHALAQQHFDRLVLAGLQDDVDEGHAPDLDTALKALCQHILKNEPDYRDFLIAEASSKL